VQTTSRRMKEIFSDVPPSFLKHRGRSGMNKEFFKNSYIV
jgi:hypothetical protein